MAQKPRPRKLPVNKRRLFIKEVRGKPRKPRTRKTSFWVLIVLLAGASFCAWWAWPSLLSGSPQLNFILIEKNDSPLKLLNKEAIRLNPRDKIKILDIATNIRFNHGVRLIAEGFDVNALLYEKRGIASLLPHGDIFNRYRFNK